MISSLKNVKRLRQESTLRVEKVRKYMGIYAEERRQSPIDTKKEYGELIAKDAGSASQQGLAVTKDVPCKTSLGGEQISRGGREYLTHGRPGIRRWIANS